MHRSCLKTVLLVILGQVTSFGSIDMLELLGGGWKKGVAGVFVKECTGGPTYYNMPCNCSPQTKAVVVYRQPCVCVSIIPNFLGVVFSITRYKHLIPTAPFSIFQLTYNIQLGFKMKTVYAFD